MIEELTEQNLIDGIRFSDILTGKVISEWPAEDRILMIGPASHAIYLLLSGKVNIENKDDIVLYLTNHIITMTYALPDELNDHISFLLKSMKLCMKILTRDMEGLDTYLDILNCLNKNESL